MIITCLGHQPGIPVGLALQVHAVKEFCGKFAEHTMSAHPNPDGGQEMPPLLAPSPIVVLHFLRGSPYGTTL